MSLPRRQIGPFSVSALGLGCMNLSHAYDTPPPPERAQRLLLRGLELGITHFDTAALYGFGANEELVGRTLSPHRSQFTLASKGGMHGDSGRRVIDGRPAAIIAGCEHSLRRLRSDVIDLYYLHRWDKSVPIEDSMGALAQLVRAGKVRALGLSEVSAATLRRAHAVHPVVAVQSEYSLWTRNPEIAVLAACRELGVRFVAFSPIGRGWLSGGLLDAEQLLPKDIRRTMPRFLAPQLEANRSLLEEFRALADELGCSPAQLALAWLLARRPEVLPLPGTRSIEHLEENLGAIDVPLSAVSCARLEALFRPDRIAGHRYGPDTQLEIDTEEFASPASAAPSL